MLILCLSYIFTTVAMSIISIETISTMSVTLTSTTTTTTMKINSMGCFHCQSVNGSNPVCDDPFNSTRAFYEGYYQSSCLSGMKDRAGLYPSSACLKLKGYHSEFFLNSEQNKIFTDINVQKIYIPYARHYNPRFV